MAKRPRRFHVESVLDNEYVLVPRVSSERRHYVPIGFISPNVLSSDSVIVLSNANLYHFGVLTSSVHMAWMREVAGRLKSDYRYSKDIVYNNFPWSAPTAKQKLAIKSTAQRILAVRDNYPDSSLADLYDPLTMPDDLLKAHRANDRAVMRAYGFKNSMSESGIVAKLFELYKEKVDDLDILEKERKKSKKSRSKNDEKASRMEILSQAK